MKRKLAVILASDVAKYSSLVAVDEEDTVKRFSAIATRFTEIVNKYHGRIFNTAGDAILAEFDSPVSAVRAATDVHEAARAENIDQPTDRRIEFRIGLAIGDVIVTQNNDLLGDGVNIAARLQTLADPGGICLSDEVYIHVCKKLELRFVDLGQKDLKNIPHPVHAYRVVNGLSAGAEGGMPAKKWNLIAAALLFCVVAGGSVAWMRFNQTNQTSPIMGASIVPRQFIAGDVPFISDTMRERLKGYIDAPEFKAIALSRTGLGVAVRAEAKDAAESRALNECRSNSYTPCELYAAGNALVWAKQSLPMPLPVDIRTETVTEPLSVETIPLASTTLTERLRNSYLPGENSKALAINASAIGWVIGALSTPEAIRIALQRCADLAGKACLLYATGNDVMQPIPRTRRITGIFIFADDSIIPATERTRLIEIYVGKDWRSLARGANGSWHAVSGASTEVAAIEEVMRQCNSADHDCVLYAIGNFLVD